MNNNRAIAVFLGSLVFSFLVSVGLWWLFFFIMGTLGTHWGFYQEHPWLAITLVIIVNALFFGLFKRN